MFPECSDCVRTGILWIAEGDKLILFLFSLISKFWEIKSSLFITFRSRNQPGTSSGPAPTPPTGGQKEPVRAPVRSLFYIHFPEQSAPTAWVSDTLEQQEEFNQTSAAAAELLCASEWLSFSQICNHHQRSQSGGLLVSVLDGLGPNKTLSLHIHEEKSLARWHIHEVGY